MGRFSPYCWFIEILWVSLFIGLHSVPKVGLALSLALYGVAGVAGALIGELFDRFSVGGIISLLVGSFVILMLLALVCTLGG